MIYVVPMITLALHPIIILIFRMEKYDNQYRLFPITIIALIAIAWTYFIFIPVNFMNEGEVAFLPPLSLSTFYFMTMVANPILPIVLLVAIFIKRPKVELTLLVFFTALVGLTHFQILINRTADLQFKYIDGF